MITALRVPAAAILAVACSMPAAVAADNGKTIQAIKNCETVRTQSVARKSGDRGTKNPGDTMRAEHPIRIRVPVEPCEPPRKKNPTAVK
jgi:hypothetical protein